MKEQELEELRQQEANKTALAAIGPRKKRKFDDLVSRLEIYVGVVTRS